MSDDVGVYKALVPPSMFINSQPHQASFRVLSRSQLPHLARSFFLSRLSLSPIQSLSYSVTKMQYKAFITLLGFSAVAAAAPAPMPQDSVTEYTDYG